MRYTNRQQSTRTVDRGQKRDRRGIRGTQVLTADVRDALSVTVFKVPKGHQKKINDRTRTCSQTTEYRTVCERTSRHPPHNEHSGAGGHTGYNSKSAAMSTSAGGCSISLQAQPNHGGPSVNQPAASQCRRHTSAYLLEYPSWSQTGLHRLH